jgi:membrane-associated phospholipid phosphatase
VLWIEWVLLCISILTTKQHYLFDLVTGIAVAQLAWMVTKPTLDEIGEMGPSAFAEECGWNA